MEDGIYYPVKEIKGCYEEVIDGEKKLVFRLAWEDSDVLAENVDAPDLPFNGFVNPDRRVTKLWNLPTYSYKRTHREMACRQCKQVFRRRRECLRHEEFLCRAPGAMKHVCGPSCRPDCPTPPESYIPPPDRRASNPGRPRKQ